MIKEKKTIEASEHYEIEIPSTISMYLKTKNENESLKSIERKLTEVEVEASACSSSILEFNNQMNIIFEDPTEKIVSQIHIEQNECQDIIKSATVGSIERRTIEIEDSKSSTSVPSCSSEVAKPNNEVEPSNIEEKKSGKRKCKMKYIDTNDEIESCPIKKTQQGTSLDPEQIAYFFNMFKTYIQKNTCYEIIRPLVRNLQSLKGYGTMRNITNQFNKAFVYITREISTETKELNAYVNTAKLIHLLEEHKSELTEEKWISNVVKALLSVEFTQLWISLIPVVFGNQFRKYVTNQKYNKKQLLHSIELWKSKKKEMEEGKNDIQVNLQFYYEELSKLRKRGATPFELSDIIRCLFFLMEDTKCELYVTYETTLKDMLAKNIENIRIVLMNLEYLRRLINGESIEGEINCLVCSVTRILELTSTLQLAINKIRLTLILHIEENLLDHKNIMILIYDELGSIIAKRFLWKIDFSDSLIGISLFIKFMKIIQQSHPEYFCNMSRKRKELLGKLEIKKYPLFLIGALNMFFYINNIIIIYLSKIVNSFDSKSSSYIPLNTEENINKFVEDIFSFLSMINYLDGFYKSLNTKIDYCANIIEIDKLRLDMKNEISQLFHNANFNSLSVQSCKSIKLEQHSTLIKKMQQMLDLLNLL